VTSAILGHASVAFTSNTYQHHDDADLDTARAGIEAAFGKAIDAGR
jgi:hypothetical protein